MAELYFVRHGQASFGSADYDRLSPLGEQQGVWLGEYLAERGIGFDRVVTGSMLRHRQTAEAIFRGLGAALPATQDPGLDEYDFQALFSALGDDHPEVRALVGGSARDYYRVLRIVLRLWSEDRLGAGVPESREAFRQRVAAARERILNGGVQRVLVVSSGGPMATFAQQVLQAPDSTAIELNMQVRNTAFCHYYFNAASCYLASFNSIPHLDLPARRDSITYG